MEDHPTHPGELSSPLEEKFHKKKWLMLPSMIVFNVFLLALIAFFGASTINKIKERGYIGQEIETKNTVIVSGTGRVYAKPDLVIVDFSVLTEKKTVPEAMKENTKSMNEIIAFLKGLGVEEKDLKTTNFNISPRYEYEKGGETYTYYYPEGKRVLVGYDVTQTLEVKIRNMDKIGEAIEGATAKGANQVSDLQFTIDKEEDFKKQAREEAIKEAKDKAKELASQLGVKLVKITNFSEGLISPIYRYAYDSAAATGMGGGESTPQVETGENKIEVNVTITYEIN